jgi:glutathione S-transferase
MYLLYHFSLCPFSRKVRVIASENNIELRLIEEKIWNKRIAFLKVNPLGTVPLLAVKTSDPLFVYDSNVILEFFDRAHEKCKIFPKDFTYLIEVKKLCLWFDEILFTHVTHLILEEKIFNYLKHDSTPDQDYIMAANDNLRKHLDYLSFVLGDKNWLVGEEFTLADICGAAHFSVLEYLNVIDWNNCPVNIKNWYFIVKSRPSFQPILNDEFPGFPPSKNYKSLDW